jgi:oligopeptidase B
MSPKPEPPVAERQPHVTELHGERRVDDYHWMRDRDDPRVRAYLEAENAYTDAVMEPVAALKQQLYDEILARIKQTDLSVPSRIGEYFYYSRTEEGKQYRTFCRRHGSLDGDEQVILDQNALAEGHPYCALRAMAVSPDHRVLAFSVDLTGAERYTIRFKDLRSGEMLEDEIPGAYTDIAWGNDNRTVFYTTLDEAHRPHRVWRHRLGEDSADDELIYQDADEAFYVGVEKTRSRQYVLITSGSNTTTEVRWLDADTPDGEFRLMRARESKHEYYVEHHGSRFLILSNKDAIDFKLVEAPVEDPSKEHWSERIAHRPGVMLESVDAFRGHQVLVEREDGLRRLRVFDVASGEEHHVDFPEPVYTVSVGSNPEFDTTELRFVYTSLVTPDSVFDYDMRSRERELKKETEVLGGYDRTQYVSERVRATAADGTPVPISLVYRKGLSRDGSAPLELYGYGSYGISSNPGFSSERLSLLDRGFVCAIAHIRGGGDLGRRWYENGKLLDKKHTFDDFIACAEFLVDEGYTASDRLVIRGGSAGGLLMGAVVNARPDLFGVVVAKVPFVDVVNTMLDASLPLTVTEWEEWGNPQEKEFYDYIRSYSPYDNIEPREYPHMLITSGLNDPRVSYWEPTKWTAKLRTMNRGKSTILLKTNMGAGHAGASGRYDALDERALEYAFVLRHLDAPFEAVK